MPASDLPTQDYNTTETSHSRDSSSHGSLAALTFGSLSRGSSPSISSSLGARNVDQRLLQDEVNVPNRPSQSETICIYECPFDRLDCRLTFSSFGSWYAHSLTHFFGHEPPTSNSCCFCDAKFKHNDGHESWHQRMEHVELHHCNGHRLRSSRCDIELYRYLWKHRVLPAVDFKELTGMLASTSSSSVYPDITELRQRHFHGDVRTRPRMGQSGNPVDEKVESVATQPVTVSFSSPAPLLRPPIQGQSRFSSVTRTPRYGLSIPPSPSQKPVTGSGPVPELPSLQSSSSPTPQAFHGSADETFETEFSRMSEIMPDIQAVVGRTAPQPPIPRNTSSPTYTIETTNHIHVPIFHEKWWPTINLHITTCTWFLITFCAVVFFGLCLSLWWSFWKADLSGGFTLGAFVIGGGCGLVNKFHSRHRDFGQCRCKRPQLETTIELGSYGPFHGNANHADHEAEELTECAT